MKLDNINYGTHLSGLDVAQKYIFTCAIHKIPKQNGMNGWKISIFFYLFLCPFETEYLLHENT